MVKTCLYGSYEGLKEWVGPLTPLSDMMPCHLQVACYLAYPSIIQFNETANSHGVSAKREKLQPDADGDGSGFHWWVHNIYC